MIPNYRIAVRTGPNAGKSFPLIKPEMLVGRESNMDVVIKDPEVSRKHARVFMQGSSYYIEDLGSTNGTSINGQRISGAHLLQVGEVITLGEKITLVFEQLTESEMAAANMEAANPPATVPRPGTPSPYQQPFQPPVPPSYQQVPVPPPYQQASATPQYQSIPPAQQPAYLRQQQPPQAPQPVPMPPQAPISPLVEEPYPDEPPNKKKFPVWAIVLIILAVLCLCLALIAVIVVTQTEWGCSIYELFGFACVTT
jgi:predicted component of type VI protein secretion system